MSAPSRRARIRLALAGLGVTAALALGTLVAPSAAIAVTPSPGPNPTPAVTVAATPVPSSAPTPTSPASPAATAAPKAVATKAPSSPTPFPTWTPPSSLPTWDPPGPVPTTPAPVSPGSIKGTVREAGSGTPLAGVTVSLSEASGASTTRITTETASDGRYTLTSVPAGTYRVGFLPSDGAHAQEYWNNGTSWMTGTNIAVGTTAVAGIDADLDRAGAISGRVTREGSTSPLVDAHVTVYPVGSFDSFWAPTDSAGNYVVTGLRTGSYHVKVSPPLGSSLAPEWYANRISDATANAVDVVADSTTGGVNAALGVPASISGTVRSAAGAPVPRALVILYDSLGTSVGYASANAAGEFTATGLTAGSYRVSFQASGYPEQWWRDSPTAATSTAVKVTSAQKVTGIDPVLVSGATISGTVTGADTKAGIEHVWIGVFTADEREDVAGYAYTDEAGRYTVSGLATGAYRMKFAQEGQNTRYAFEWAGGAASSTSSTPVTVVQGEATAPQDVELDLAAMITGTVKDAKTLKGIPQATVSVFDAEGHAVGSTYASKTGGYSVGSLRAGTYYLKFDAMTPSYAVQWWSNKATLASASPIVVAAGQTVTSRSPLMKVPATVTGTVRNAAGTGLKDVFVTARVGDDVVGSAVTAADGRYTMAGLPPASVTVGFSDRKPGDSTSASRYEDAYWQNASQPASATRVALVAGTPVSGIDATLKARPKVFAAAPVPAVTGAAVVGTTLKLVAGTWSPKPAFAYQWLRSGTPIAGATKSSYTLTATDAGATISASVTGTKTGYVTTTVTSAPTATVLRALTATPVPSISGVAAVGKKLTAQPGAWSPAPVALTYQWQRNGKAIPGATKSTYFTTATDAGKTLSLTVTGTKAGYAPVTLVSAALAIPAS